LSDSSLIKPLRTGQQYDKLIPLRFCESVKLGKGDTRFSVDKMAQWVGLHHAQMVNVAQLLKKETLQPTVATVHDFAYWHFQYKKDDENQLVKSPSCAWYSRAEGMDCKSFTVVCSSLLVCMGINHYIRRVKQPFHKYPDAYTHVYVIVPINQNTNDLNSGYLTLDATILENQETIFTEPKDLLIMSNQLQHYGLNGVAARSPSNNHGLGFSLGSTLGSIKNLNFSSIFGSLSCLGGSAYEKGDLERLLPAITAKYDFIYNDLNVAIATNDMEKLSVCQSLCVCWPIISVEKMDAIFYSNKWNKCTDATIHTTKAIHQSFTDIVTPLMEAYLNQYFIRTKSGLISHRVMDYQPGAPSFAEMFFSDLGRNAVHQVDKFTFMRKPGVTSIPKFEFTNDVKNALNNGTPAPTPAQYLASIANTVIGNNPVTPPSGSGNTSGGNYSQEPSPGSGNTSDDKDKDKGLGVLGWTLIGTAAIGGTIMAVNEIKKNKKNGAK